MKGIEGDLASLEEDLRRLEFEYDQFLSGQARTLPLKREGRIQGVIRSFGGRAIQNSALRFRYNNLVARYNSLRKVWERKVREKEEGRAVGRPLRSPASTPSRPLPPLRHPQGQGRFVASDLMDEKDKMRDIFNTYKKLRQECGVSTDKLRLESFTKVLAEKVEKLRSSKGCAKVEISLDRQNDKLRIMVRPHRNSEQVGK